MTTKNNENIRPGQKLYSAFGSPSNINVTIVVAVHPDGKFDVRDTNRAAKDERAYTFGCHRGYVGVTLFYTRKEAAHAAFLRNLKG